jgi:hypothetical protein
MSAAKASNIVVRTHAPVRRVITAIAFFALGVFALYVVYELGRYDAGYDRLAVSQERAEFEVGLERGEKANRELRTRLAELDMIRIGRAREQAEVSRTIGDLQAQVARQAQELAFYRGIVAQAGSALGVKIQQLRISPGEQPSRFKVRLTLVRSVRPDDVVTGAVVLSVDGDSGGKTATLDLASLTGAKQKELPFTFRYFENFDQEIGLPTGFRPQRLIVEVRSSRKGTEPLTQTFPWSVDAQ